MPKVLLEPVLTRLAAKADLVPPDIVGWDLTTRPGHSAPGDYTTRRA